MNDAEIGPLLGLLSFRQLVDLVRGWRGHRVGVTVQGPSEGGGNTTLHVWGVLSEPRDVEVVVIDPRGGEVAAFQVGDGRFQMMEGDFVSAEIVDFADGQLHVSADFREVVLSFVGVPKST